MNGCFLLKDPDGRTGGYLLQRVEEMRVCARRMPTNAQVMVCFDDGSRKILNPADGQEILTQSDGRSAAGAVVFSGEEILLSTGEQACRAFLAAVQRERKPSDSEEIRSGAASKETLRKKNNCAEETGEEKRLSETDLRGSSMRRWPPPPCVNEAHYVRGKWQEDELVYGSGEVRSDRRTEAP